jgi:pyocin large subunit-like protein
VLLAVADAANAEGANSYQSVATICRMTGLGRSTCLRSLRSLRETGVLEVTGTSGPRYRETVVYRIPALTTPSQIGTGSQSDA